MKRTYFVQMLCIVPFGAALALSFLLFRRGDVAMSALVGAITIAAIAGFIVLVQELLWEKLTTLPTITFHTEEGFASWVTADMYHLLSPQELVFLSQVATDGRILSTTRLLNMGTPKTFWAYSRECVTPVGRVERSHCDSNGFYSYSVIL